MSMGACLFLNDGRDLWIESERSGRDRLIAELQPVLTEIQCPELVQEYAVAPGHPRPLANDAPLDPVARQVSIERPLLRSAPDVEGQLHQALVVDKAAHGHGVPEHAVEQRGNGGDHLAISVARVRALPRDEKRYVVRLRWSAPPLAVAQEALGVGQPVRVRRSVPDPAHVPGGHGSLSESVLLVAGREASVAGRCPAADTGWLAGQERFRSTILPALSCPPPRARPRAMPKLSLGISASSRRICRGRRPSSTPAPSGDATHSSRRAGWHATPAGATSFSALLAGATRSQTRPPSR